MTVKMSILTKRFRPVELTLIVVFMASIISIGSVGYSKFNSKVHETIVFTDYGVPDTGYGNKCPATDNGDSVDKYHTIRGDIRWKSFPVTYKFGVSTFPSSWTTAITNAFETWDAAVGDGLNHFEYDANSSNVVTFETIDGPGGVLARASITYVVSTKEIFSFNIKFDKVDAWSTDGNPSRFDIQNAATHQIGNILGLGDVKKERACWLTMYESMKIGETSKSTLGHGDILGVQDLYKQSLDAEIDDDDNDDGDSGDG